MASADLIARPWPPEVQLDVVLEREAVATVKLQALPGGPERAVGSEHKRHAGQRRRVRLARVPGPGRLVDQQLGTVPGQHDVGQAVLDGLEGADDDAERLARLAPGRRVGLAGCTILL